jgi:hypothetical protein
MERNMVGRNTIGSLLSYYLNHLRWKFIVTRIIYLVFYFWICWPRMNLSYFLYTSNNIIMETIFHHYYIYKRYHSQHIYNHIRHHNHTWTHIVMTLTLSLWPKLKHEKGSRSKESFWIETPTSAREWIPTLPNGLGTCVSNKYGPKLASIYHWKGMEVYISKLRSHFPCGVVN